MKFRLVENYKPITAYNGSDKKFEKFSDSTKGKDIGTGQFDIPGIFFSSNKDLARGYACGYTAGGYTDDDGVEHKFTRASHKGYLYTCKLNYTKPIIIDYHKENNQEAWDKREEVRDNIKDYINGGYDIVIMKNIPYTNGPKSEEVVGYGTEYVVLNPDIIEIADFEECEPEEDNNIK